MILRSLTASALLLCASACLDADEAKRELPSITRAKEQAHADARARQGLNPPLGELKQFDETAADAGSAAVMPKTIVAEPVQAPSQPDGQALLRGWGKATPGDYAVIGCSHFVNMFGNRVRRRAQLRLEVVAEDAVSVILRISGTGSEEHDSSRPEVKRKHWKLDLKGSAELVMLRGVDQGLGAPLPARHLGSPAQKQVAVGQARVLASCSRLEASGTEARDRCVAAETAKHYLTAGLISELSADTSNGCRLLESGGVVASKRNARDKDGTEYLVLRRGDQEFRERVLTAAGGLVKLEVQRLRYLRRAEPGSVVFEKKHYAPDVIDTRSLHLVDWALRRIVPGFPPQLAMD